MSGGVGGVATAGSGGKPNGGSGGKPNGGSGGKPNGGSGGNSSGGKPSGGSEPGEEPGQGAAPGEEPSNTGATGGGDVVGSAGTRGRLPDTAPPHDSSGCGCTVPGAPTSGRDLLLLTLGAAALVRARRRRAA
jgi:MYXO-CTERM domain-containing protein